MKTFVLCSREDKALAEGVLRMLRTLDLNGTAYAISDAWKAEHRHLDELLAPASHLIVVYSSASARSSWLPFAAGFSLGSDRPLVLYRSGNLPAVEPYLSPFFLVSSYERLQTFLEAEQREWTLIAARRDARRELLDLGVSFRGDAFADSVREGNVHAVDLFLKAGFSVDTKDRKGVPLLCLAVREGHRSLAGMLLENGAAIDLQSEDRGNTALMDAAASGKDELVADLLAHTPALDLQSKDGQTALVLAVGKNDKTVAAALLEAGANPDLADKLGFTARKYAQLFHDPEMVALFARFPAVVA